MQVSASALFFRVTGPAVLPDVVPFAVRLSISDKARARFVKVLAALGTFETGGVPLQVRGDPQDILVVDLVAATRTQRHEALLWKEHMNETVHTFCSLLGPCPKSIQKKH